MNRYGELRLMVNDSLLKSSLMASVVFVTGAMATRFTRNNYSVYIHTLKSVNWPSHL